MIMKRKKKGKNALPSPEESLLEIKKLARIVASHIAIKLITDLASTDERKAIWVLCTGKFTRKQISSMSGIHINTVKSFVEMAMTYGLLEEEKGKGGHPKRVIDYVPSDWKEKVKKEKRATTEEKPTEKLEPQKNQ